MTGYEFSRGWFEYSFANSRKVKPIHTAIFFFAIECCNRLGWKEEFGFPTNLAMETLGIKNYKTYIQGLQDLVDWGFIIWIQKSKNQFTANSIALVKNHKALPKALPKAVSKASPKHYPKQVQSIASIDKLINNTKPLNLETLKQTPLLEIKSFEVFGNQKIYYQWAFKFQKLFLKNLENRGGPKKKIEEATYEELVTPIEKMMKEDGINQKHLQLAYEALEQDEFWQGIILSTEKLRSKIIQLIAQRKLPLKTKEMDRRVQDKIKSYD